MQKSSVFIFSLSIIFWKFIQFLMFINTLILFTAKWYLMLWMNHSLGVNSLKGIWVASSFGLL